MPTDTYPFELPPLPYAYNALEPYIDEETMRIHHNAHFQTYIDGLNKALAPYPNLHSCTLRQLLSSPSRLPAEACQTILRQGGGVYNHEMFFRGLAPVDSGLHRPTASLAGLLRRSFPGGEEQFKEKFVQCALEVFGSGWTLLALTPRGVPEIFNLKNQDTLLCTRNIPLLLVDVWEHAYYLKYKNKRAEYLRNIWNVLTYPAL